MKLLKKTIHLNYSEPKGDKKIIKNYSYDVKDGIDDTTLREVGNEITKLIDKTIDNVTVTTKTLI